MAESVNHTTCSCWATTSVDELAVIC